MNTTSIFAFFQKSVYHSFIYALLVMTACGGKDNDTQPVTSGPVELPTGLLGTYTGTVTYTNTSTSPVTTIAKTNATAMFAKTGDKIYSVTFSDNVPAITTLTFEAPVNGTYGSMGGDGTGAGVAVSATGTAIGYRKDPEGWQFQGKK